jgi:hypothetical protein
MGHDSPSDTTIIAEVTAHPIIQTNPSTQAETYRKCQATVYVVFAACMSQHAHDK